MRKKTVKVEPIDELRRRANEVISDYMRAKSNFDGCEYSDKLADIRRDVESLAEELDGIEDSMIDGEDVDEIES